MNFKDVLIIPKSNTDIKSRENVSIGRISPIVASNMDTIGTMEMAKTIIGKKCMTMLHKYYSIEELMSFYSENRNYYDFVGVSSGVSTKDISRLQSILDTLPIKIVCLDVAHGGMKHFIAFCKSFKKQYPEKLLIAGNICTYSGYKLLSDAGVDIVKAGIGGGSVCSTRDVTGVGYPQLQMIIDIVRRKRWKIGKKALLMSDGNCKTSGDICKALVAGADFVMIGGLLAGTHESAGEIIDKQGKRYKEFYGMASETALLKHNNRNEYRPSEGITKLVEYSGFAKNIIQELHGGIKSCCSYLNIDDASKLKYSGKFKRLK